MHANLAKIRGARQVILADIQPRRLKLAQGFGADVLIDSKRKTSARGSSRKRRAPARRRHRGRTLGRRAGGIPHAGRQHGRVSFFGGLPKSNPFISFNSNLVHYKELFVMGAYGSAPRTTLRLSNYWQPARSMRRT